MAGRKSAEEFWSDDQILKKIPNARLAHLLFDDEAKPSAPIVYKAFTMPPPAKSGAHLDLESARWRHMGY